MNNVLVTGSLGFIGSWFTKLLVDTTNYDITMIDNNTYAADISRLKEIEDKIDFINKIYIGDICNNDLCNEIIEDNNIDTIVNICADTHVDNSIKDSKQFIQSNYVGVWNLLEICRKNDNNIRFLQVSTDEVYGSTTYDDQSFKETDRLWPRNPYSATKAAADLLCLSYVNTYNSNIVITRSSNNYGPYQHVEKFIPRMISLAMNGKDLEVYGNGNNIRDWLYVEDNCEAIKLVMEKGRTGDIYNISSYEEMTNNQVAEIIAERFGVGIKYIEDRKGHDFRYSIDSNKIISELGWEAKMNFDEGLEKTIDFYLNNSCLDQKD